MLSLRFASAGLAGAWLRRMAPVVVCCRSPLIPCHAEGRGFESHHPLSEEAPLRRGFLSGSRSGGRRGCAPHEPRESQPAALVADCASLDSGVGEPRHTQSTGGEGCRETASALDPLTARPPRRPLRAALTMNAIQSLGVRPSPLRLSGSYVSSSSSCQLLTADRTVATSGQIPTTPLGHSRTVYLRGGEPEREPEGAG